MQAGDAKTMAVSRVSRFNAQLDKPRSSWVRGTLLTLLLMGILACTPEATDEVQSLSGAKVTLSGSDWLVVNYWAEWCGPCRHEIPELNELDGYMGDAKPGLSVRVLGVNYDGLRDQKLRDVSERMGIGFDVLLDDPRQRWGQEIPTVLPSTYLIAPGGDFVETLLGPQTRAGILSRIETLIAQRPES